MGVTCHPSTKNPPAAGFMYRLPFILLILSVIPAGCATFGVNEGIPAHNTVFVPVANQEVAWERTMDAIRDFRFPVIRESQLDGVIETDYVVGSGLFEPWNHDSVGMANRWEDTFQSTRRRLRVRLVPAQGGYLVSAEAFKELEDVRGGVENSTGGATFQTNQALQRDLNVVDELSAPSGWMPLGRDAALEQALLRRIQVHVR